MCRTHFSAHAHAQSAGRSFIYRTARSIKSIGRFLLGAYIYNMVIFPSNLMYISFRDAAAHTFIDQFS
jgi:hypothetical protein